MTLLSNKKLCNFHLVNGNIFTRELSNDELMKIRKEWLIGKTKKCGEIVIGNYIVQAEDLILIGLDITE